MSIALALVGTDGILVATDSATMSYKNAILEIANDSQKLWTLKDNLALMHVTTDREFTDWIREDIEVVTGLDKLRKLGFKGKVQSLSAYLISKYGIYYQYPESMEQAIAMTGENDVMEFVIAGYTKYTKSKIAQIVSLRSGIGASLFRPRPHHNWHIAGVIDVANYLFDKVCLGLYSNKWNGEPLQTTKILQNVAAWIIYEMSQRTKTVGFPIQMAVIPKDGDLYHVKKKDILRLQEIVTDKSKRLKELTLNELINP
ncbi:MAG: hypothetical protein ABSB31_06605 [Dehalococcoidia bacterium]|jgi:hypothetical protein